jgi:hypothetical protein
VRCDGLWTKGFGVDRIELVQIVLCHPEATIQVDFGRLLLDVRDVRYAADRESVVLLLHPEDVRDALRAGGV